MPTYRNDDTSKIYLLEGLDGHTIELKPGQSGQSYKFYDYATLGKTSDEPRWNPFLGVDSLSGDPDNDAEVQVEPDTVGINVVNNSGVQVTLYLRHKDNTPGIPVGDGEVVAMQDDFFGQKVEKLIFAFAEEVGSGVTVYQNKK